MDDWDQETLEKVVASKSQEYNKNKPTDIVSVVLFHNIPCTVHTTQYFLIARVQQKYPFFTKRWIPGIFFNGSTLAQFNVCIVSVHIVSKLAGRAHIIILNLARHDETQVGERERDRSMLPAVSNRLKQDDLESWLCRMHAILFYIFVDIGNWEINF